MRAPDSKTPLARSRSLKSAFKRPVTFTKNNLKKPADFGFKIEEVKIHRWFTFIYINRTMMRINLPKPLAPGNTFQFKIKWNYLINNSVKDGGRSGFEAIS